MKSKVVGENSEYSTTFLSLNPGTQHPELSTQHFRFRRSKLVNSGKLVSKTLILTLFLGMTAGITLAQRGGGRIGGGGGMRPGGGARPAEGQRPTRQSGTSTGEKTTGQTGPAGRQRRQPTGANLSEQQRQNIQKLQSDLTSIKSGSQVTQQQKDALKQSLNTLAEGTTKPSQQSIDNLSNHLSSAMSDGNLSNQEKAQLAQDVQAVFDSASIPQSEVQQVISDAQSILQSSGVDKSDVQLIVTDLQNIAAEAKKNAGTRVPRKQ